MMKNILIISILILIPFASISQNTNISLTYEQAIEIYKGLIQGSNSKDLINILDLAIKQSDSIHESNEEIIGGLKAEIKELNGRIIDKDKYIANQSKINDFEQAILKSKAKKQFGFGLLLGGGYGNGNTDFQGFIGIGIAWQPFRF